MKKRLFLILFPFLLLACHQEEPFLFDDEPGIYFSSNNTKLNYDFAFYFTDGFDEWGYPISNYYLGDSLRIDTIKFTVFRSGMLDETNNTFNPWLGKQFCTMEKIDHRP